MLSSIKVQEIDLSVEYVFFVKNKFLCELILSIKHVKQRNSAIAQQFNFAIFINYGQNSSLKCALSWPILMLDILLLNKPYDVLCQFTDENNRPHLGNYINDKKLNDFYPAGRLDRDSEGLVVLTNHGKLQHHISNPKFKMPKTYWVQVEGDIPVSALKQLERGVQLKDGITKPAQALKIADIDVWPRVPDIRKRANIPTSWISLTISEGKNRQVRRMTAAVGYPTLRLIRYSVGQWTINNILPGSFVKVASNITFDTTPVEKKFTYKRELNTKKVRTKRR